MDTANRTKQQTIEWERIFTNPPSDRRLIFNIYKELKNWAWWHIPLILALGRQRQAVF